MSQVLGYTGFRAGRRFFVPSARRGYFRQQGGRILAMASPEILPAAQSAYGGGRRIVRLDLLEIPPSAPDDTATLGEAPERGAHPSRPAPEPTRTRRPRGRPRKNPVT